MLLDVIKEKCLLIVYILQYPVNKDIIIANFFSFGCFLLILQFLVVYGDKKSLKWFDKYIVLNYLMGWGWKLHMFYIVKWLGDYTFLVWNGEICGNEVNGKVGFFWIWSCYKSFSCSKYCALINNVEEPQNQSCSAMT